jgi:phage tail-like protein
MTDRKDPFRGFNFRLEMSGVTEAGFRECSGLDASTDVAEYREGKDQGNFPRKLTGLNKHANITLKRGIDLDNKVWEWYKKVVGGKTERQDGSIVIYDEAGQPQSRWNFKAAWPTKVTGPTLNATSNDVAIESVEIVCEELEREK